MKTTTSATEILKKRYKKGGGKEQYHELNYDGDAFNSAHLDDLWVFDKLVLSKKLGYVCGAKGMDVPAPGNYVVRPCVNLMGMGAGAHVQWIRRTTDYALPDGSFWCEMFEGKYFSVDYHRKKQVLCVEGTLRDRTEDLVRWDIWRTTPQYQIPFPEILNDLKGDYEWINAEFIGSKLIEVHLRQNPDFCGHNSRYVIPVWNGEDIDPQEGQRYIHRLDLPRIGFYIEDVL